MSLILKHEFKKLELSIDSKIYPELVELDRPAIGEGTVSFPKSDSDITSLDLKKQMQQMTSYFSEFKSIEIATPFQARCLLMTKDKKKIFVAGREGRLAIIQTETKEILNDVDLKIGSIQTMDFCENEKVLFVGGSEGKINKYAIENMTLLDSFIGTVGLIEKLIIANDKLLYSLEANGSVVKWTLETKSFVRLYSHNCEIITMDLSYDNEFLASVGEDKSIIVFDIKANVISTLIHHPLKKTIWCLAISQNKNFLAFGDSLGKVYLYNFFSWDIYNVFEGHSGKVKSLAISVDEKYLITGGSDHAIIIWDLIEKKEGMRLKGHTDTIKLVNLSDDLHYLYSMADDSTIKIWKIPRFDQYTFIKLEHDTGPLDEILIGKVNSRKIYMYSSSKLVSVDRFKNKELLIQDFSKLIITCYAFSDNSDLLCIISRSEQITSKIKNQLVLIKYSIIFFEYDKIEYLYNLEIESYGIYSVLFSKNGEFLLFGEMHHCRIYSLKTLEIYHTFKNYQREIISLVQSIDGKLLFSGDNKGCIRFYDFWAKKEIAGVQGNDSEVLKLAVSPNNEYLISIHKNFEIIVWIASKMIKIHSIFNHNFKDILFVRDSSMFLLLNNNSITGIVLPTIVTSFIIRTAEDASQFCLSLDEKELFVHTKNTIYIFLNPLECKEIISFGDQENLYEFSILMGKLVNGNLEKHDSLLNNWVIEPFHLNVLHFYAYLEKYKFLKECFHQNVGFFCSKSGFSPLDISLEMNSEKCISEFYVQLKKKYRKNNPIFFSVLENSLIKLNRCQYQDASKYYKFAFRSSYDTSLPKFCISNRKLPIIVLSDDLLTPETSFMNTEEYSNEGTALKFKQTYFKMSMIPGSNQSLEFIKSIIDTQNDTLLMDEFISLILYEKWRKVFFVLYIQAFFYVIYLFGISYYAIFKQDTLYLTFSTNILLIVYEIFQFFFEGIDYFHDPWNYVDLLRFLLMTIYFGDQLSGSMQESYYFTASLLFVSWIRGFSYFRLIQNTRYYINLIYKVLGEIFPFLTIVIYETVAFSLIFTVLMHDDTEYFYLKTAWEVNIGGFTTSSYTLTMYFAFFLHSLINPIILLNLLISIISNTFKKINSRSTIADCKELAEMILEAEVFFYWNRKNKSKHYVHICSNIHSKSRDIETNRYNKMKQKLTDLKISQKELEKDLKKIAYGINSKLDKIIEVNTGKEKYDKNRLSLDFVEEFK